MGLIGPAFVGGTGALAFLLAAEVVAATAVVSEAALVYIARFRNLLISLATIALQAALTVGGILLVDQLGLGQICYRAAAAAAALMLSLGHRLAGQGAGCCRASWASRSTTGAGRWSGRRCRRLPWAGWRIAICPNGPSWRWAFPRSWRSIARPCGATASGPEDRVLFRGQQAAAGEL